jgi:UTP-glucose-1-phosphate uridylyltransferase
MLTHKIKKAVIPAAGFGTRLFPATKVVKKELFPIGEFQLTSCLEKLRQQEGMTGYVVKGKCFDTGLPDAYRQTMIDFRMG